MQLSTALKKHLEKVDIKTRYVFFLFYVLGADGVDVGQLSLQAHIAREVEDGVLG